ncbi:MAG TPA: SRPBCC family protein [Acidimicrobiales bacterium]|nr:SRPBCC family protein [Acidimicrobiales bacterium]
MDLVADLVAPCSPGELFAWVDDLGRYPAWHSIVTAARPDGRHDGDPGPAWVVDLRARVGPLARAKRLRMVRDEHVVPERVVFVRREVDGRQHGRWELTADVRRHGAGSRLDVALHYSGGLWAPVLERLLGEEIERSRDRLLELVSDRRTV